MFWRHSSLFLIEIARFYQAHAMEHNRGHFLFPSNISTEHTRTLTTLLPLFSPMRVVKAIACEYGSIAPTSSSLKCFQNMIKTLTHSPVVRSRYVLNECSRYN